MNDVDTRKAVLQSITEVAPEADLEDLDESADLREELDIDSMDFLNILVAIHRRLGVEVAERDYAQVGTLESLVDYIQRRLA